MLTTDTLIIIFELIVLVLSAVIHEVSHGYMAERLGDPTARLSGRLTLNPLKHLDPVGSFLVPGMLAFAHLPVFGWARPVPYNPQNLRDPIRGGGVIAFAGPASNLVIAVLFAGLIRAIIFFQFAAVPTALLLLFVLIVKINVVLAVFNMVPLPPLDGSKVLYALLPSTQFGLETMRFLERYGLVLVIAFIFFGGGLIAPVMDALFSLLLGVPMN